MVELTAAEVEAGRLAYGWAADGSAEEYATRLARHREERAQVPDE